MNLRILMTVNAVIAFLFGVAFVLIPWQVYSFYAVEVNPQLNYMGQLFGAALIGYAILTWMAKGVTDSVARKAIILALFISEGIGFIVVFIGQLGNVVNAMGWSTVLIYLLLALGFGYFLLSKSDL